MNINEVDLNFIHHPKEGKGTTEKYTLYIRKVYTSKMKVMKAIDY